MSQIEKVWCDGCGKEVREGHDIGWIRIWANEDRLVDFVNGGGEYSALASEQCDFCSPQCLCRWIKRRYKEVQESS